MITSITIIICYFSTERSRASVSCVDLVIWHTCHLELCFIMVHALYSEYVWGRFCHQFANLAFGNNPVWYDPVYMPLRLLRDWLASVGTGSEKCSNLGSKQCIPVERDVTELSTTWLWVKAESHGWCSSPSNSPWKFALKDLGIENLGMKVGCAGNCSELERGGW